MYFNKKYCLKLYCGDHVAVFKQLEVVGPFRFATIGVRCRPEEAGVRYSGARRGGDWLVKREGEKLGLTAQCTGPVRNVASGQPFQRDDRYGATTIARWASHDNPSHPTRPNEKENLFFFFFLR